MKKQFLLIPILALTLFACERKDHSTRTDNGNNKTTEVNADNTGKNVRDRNGNLPTSFDQSENEVDRTITQKIRQAIVADDFLSTQAKNVKVITINGVVTLRGPVNSPKERDIIAQKAQKVSGVKNVDNHLEVITTTK